MGTLTTVDFVTKTIIDEHPLMAQIERLNLAPVTQLKVFAHLNQCALKAANGSDMTPRDIIIPLDVDHDEFPVGAGQIKGHVSIKNGRKIFFFKTNTHDYHIYVVSAERSIVFERNYKFRKDAESDYTYLCREKLFYD